MLIFLILSVSVLTLTSCREINFQEVDFSFEKRASSYKHINNGGVKSADNLPYNIDAITGATVTVEGAGVYTSIPLSVREIENAVNGQARGEYQDKNGVFIYEGLDLYYLLNDMKDGDNGIKLTDTSYKVILKNSNRESISEFTLDEVEKAHSDKRPILLAYGMADKDESVIAPFVYDGKEKGTHSIGYVEKLHNEDGCIKLVYDTNKYGKNNYKEFSNVAYVYVAEEKEPGFKHSDNAINPLYSNSEYTDYIVTFRGSELGNEVDVTVRDIEDLVKYDKDKNVVSGGLGYRDTYSLANNAYWYVNTYEGVDLYKYLMYLGMEDAKTMGLKKARTSLVKFLAADGAASNETFSVDTLSYPDAFGFYKKNVNDKNDGKYVSTNEDLVKLGFPVLVAYGVNNYPYAITKADKAYVSGLSNSGGPLHVVFGKTQYSHPNGSNQIQYLDTVVVGEDILYNTHSYTDDSDIYKYKDDKLSIVVENEKGEKIVEKNISVNEIEDLVYGEGVSKHQAKLYKVKNHYETKTNNKIESNIYEGIDLSNFLLEYIKLNGIIGAITFESSENYDDVVVNLEDIFTTGNNLSLNRENIKPIIAFAKNGKALVKDESAKGYVSDIDLKPVSSEPKKYSVQNDGGPLMILLPSRNSEKYDGEHLKNLSRITIRLKVDEHSHLSGDFGDSILNSTIVFNGAGLEKETQLKVIEIEELQTKAKIYHYNIDNEYKGVPCYELFKHIGIKNNAGDVTIYGRSGDKLTLPLSRIKNQYINEKDEKVTAMFVYGSRQNNENNETIGRPLAKNDGGPIKFVVSEEEGNKVLSVDDVVKVEVSANEIVTWSHKMSDVYSEFLNNTFTISIKNDSNDITKEYKLSELESMDDLIIRDKYHVLDIGECEGIDIWKLVKKVNPSIDNSNLVSVTFYAEDGYKNDVLSVIGLDALDNGVEFDGNRLKVLLAYAINGYPLVDNETHEGYTGLAKNTDGPMRLVVEGVQGASVKKCNKVVVTLASEDTGEQLSDNQFYDASGNVITIKENAKELTTAASYGVAVPFFTALKISDRVKGVNIKQKFWYEADTNYKDVESLGKGQFDLEKLAKVNPSSIVHRANDKQTIDDVKKLGIDALCIRVENYDDIIDTLTMMGKYFGVEGRAKQVIKYIEGKFEKIDNIVKKIPSEKKKTAIVMGGTLGRVAGKDMLQTFMIERAGGICPVDESKNNSWVNIGVEKIFEYNPDYLFLTNSTALDYDIEELYGDRVWDGMNAVKNKKIFQIPSKNDAWDMPGISCPIGTMYMLHEMYPEYFSKEELEKEIEEYYTFMFGKTFDKEYLGYNLE